MRQHNDQTDDYHLSLYEDVVIGHELIAFRDIVRIKLSLVWMLANALRAIVAGWIFQLSGDVTGNFCSRSVDLLELSVTSIPCKNNVLCLSIIPKATESEKVYTVTYADLRKVLNLSYQVRQCPNSDCDCCTKRGISEFQRLALSQPGLVQRVLQLNCRYLRYGSRELRDSCSSHAG